MVPEREPGFLGNILVVGKVVLEYLLMVPEEIPSSLKEFQEFLKWCHHVECVSLCICVSSYCMFVYYFLHIRVYRRIYLLFLAVVRGAQLAGASHFLLIGCSLCGGQILAHLLPLGLLDVVPGGVLQVGLHLRRDTVCSVWRSCCIVGNVGSSDCGLKVRNIFNLVMLFTESDR